MDDEFFDGEECCIDVKVKIIKANGCHDIIDQYIAFCRVVNDVIKEMGYTEDAIHEVYRRCMDKDILKEYLKTRESEVYSIMFTMFNQEYADEMTKREARAEGMAEGMRKGKAEGIAEGEKNGIAKGMRSAIRNLMASMKVSVDKAMDMLGIAPDDKPMYRAMLAT